MHRERCIARAHPALGGSPVLQQLQHVHCRARVVDYLCTLKGCSQDRSGGMLRKSSYMNGSSNGTDGWQWSEPKKRWTPPWKRQYSTMQRLIIIAALCSALALIYIAHGGPDNQHRIQLPYPSIDVRGYQHLAPSSLEFPVWWHAPFVAPSGLGAEAIMIIQALLKTRQLRPEDIYITHSGDVFDKSVLNSFSRETRNMLANRQHPQQVADEWISTLLPQQRQTQLQRLEDLSDGRKAIAVCHNWFDCWRKPNDDQGSAGWPGCPCPLGRDRTAYTVARTMFETAGLPAHLADHVKAMDEVWVPTQFNKETFTKAGVDPAKIRVVPQGVDTDFWNPAKYNPIDLRTLKLAQATGPAAGPNSTLPGQVTAAAVAGRPRRPYIFLSVFKWEARKGWKDLIQGFCNAFKPSDPVVLWILTKPFRGSGTDFDKKVAHYAAKIYNMSLPEAHLKLPRIYTSSQQLSEVDFVRVYKAVDALVIPTHGEGWGRPQSEAMAMGLPVITTNWSGPTAYMNDQIAYPLAVEGLSVVESDGDPNFFAAFIGQQWAQPSVKHLTHLLQHVYQHPEEAAAKGAAARKHIQQHLSPKQIASIVAQEVRRLQKVVKQKQRQDGTVSKGLFLNVQSSISKKGLFAKLNAYKSSQKNAGSQ